MKRGFDILATATGVLLLSPIFVVCILLLKLTSQGSILFRQERVGCHFKPFFIYKYRTMVQNAPDLGSQITYGQDPRITRMGSILRKTKIDELPQLINVLKGEMSLVGPRPEVPKYVDMFRDDYEIILQVRPGMTDLASIEFRDEAALLAMAEDPEKEYIQHVLPEKIRLAKEYVHQASFWLDLKIIFKTILLLVGDRFVSSGRKTEND